jgi:hypothetical protein
MLKGEGENSKPSGTPSFRDLHENEIPVDPGFDYA